MAQAAVQASDAQAGRYPIAGFLAFQRRAAVLLANRAKRNAPEISVRVGLARPGLAARRHGDRYPIARRDRAGGGDG